ncbi:MAG: SPOR domain-containing protein [Bacteroidales bacterium]|jgi:cell division protein FtsN|nr:SPOR domain-containing protein [Bacteroidales bacterium]
MKRLSFVLLAAILLLTPSCDFMKSINPFGKKAREVETLRQQQEAFRVADSIRVANEKQAEEERLRQAELTVTATEEAAAVSGYHVIVGSFLTPAYADAWLEHIKGFGYNATLIDMDGGRWQLVSAESFADLHAAWNALGRVRNNINSDAWVFRQE